MVGDLDEILAAFGVGPVSSSRRPDGGVLHDVRLVVAGGRHLVVKVFDPTARNRARREANAMAAAAPVVPVPRHLTGPDGDAWVVRDGRTVTVTERAAGAQVGAPLVTPSHAAAMGRTLATIHDRVDLRGATGRIPRPPPPVEVALERIDHVLARIGDLGERGPVDDAADRHLRARRAWIERRPPTLRRWPSLDERTSLHGDFTLANLFFEGAAVSAVIDWEMAALGAAGSEVVRTCHFCFADDAALWSAFLAGYRSVRALAEAALDEAAELHAEIRTLGLWAWEAVYLEGNERARCFITSSDFVPWIDHWAAIRAGLDDA